MFFRKCVWGGGGGMHESWVGCLDWSAASETSFKFTRETSKQVAKTSHPPLLLFIIT